MYGGMYGSSDSSHSHKHSKHHHAATYRQRHIQQSGCAVLASRWTANLAISSSTNISSLEQPVSLAPHGHPHAVVAISARRSSEHMCFTGKGAEFSTDANQTADSDCQNPAKRTAREHSDVQLPRPHFTLVERVMNFVRRTWTGLTTSEGNVIETWH